MIDFLARLVRSVCAMLVVAASTALAQDVFDGWYPQPLRYTLQVQVEGEEPQLLEYYVGDRAMRMETADTVLIVRDEDGPVLHSVDVASGSVDRLDALAAGITSNLLPLEASHHPCAEAWSCEHVSDDVLNGRPVEVWEALIQDLGETTIWVDTETRVQVRSEGTTEDGLATTSEVTDLEVGPQPAELFEPPQP